MSPTDSYPQHVVTAVIVGHDGAVWLGQSIDALLGQTRPAQRVVAVDTGSRDRSGSVLTAKLGSAAVFGMDRSTGYAAAVRRALQHKAAGTPVGGSHSVEWIWLLHDDCEPAPDALDQLLRAADETPAAAVLGPKLMDWVDRDVILEAGVGLDAVGRRITGVEPGEVDQGQHDGDRDTLAVSSAGMLVRRDVWDQVGGFDPGMTLFGEDIDLCWRVNAAGYRVRVIPEAIVYHAEAASRGRRAISVGRRSRLLQRRHALQTLVGNLPVGPMLASLAANLAISFLRTLFYLVAKRGTAALDEAAAVAAVVGHPLRLIAARRRRARGRRAAYGRVRADLPAGRSLRRAAEYAALVITRSGHAEHTASRSAIDDPTEDDSLLIDSGFLQRFVTQPGVLLTFGLIVVAVVAERSLFGGGPLGGGALLPAWEGASALWGEVLRAFHPAGVGSAGAVPPYAGFVALLATLLLGKVWLAVDVLLLGAVPLAGLTSLLALRRVTSSALIRVWAAASYALLPVAFGAVAAGRLGSAVAFVLIPVIGTFAARMFTEPPRLARRAAWATGLVVTVATAFVPGLWLIAMAAAAVAAIIWRHRRQMLINLAIVAVTPPVLLLPWMIQQLAHPSLLLLEVGVQQPGLATTALPARSLLLLSPGGPGLPPYWVSAAIVAAGLAALTARDRRVLVVSGWTVALVGFAAAVLASRALVTPAGGQPVTPWPGPALAVAAAGLLLAAAAAADDFSRARAGAVGARSGAGSASGRSGSRRSAAGRSSGRIRGATGFAIAVAALAGLSAPLLAVAYWLADGVSGPVTQAAGQVVPAVVASSTTAGRQLRTLVLSMRDGHVTYVLLRGASPELADAEIQPPSAAQQALASAVAALIAPGGDQASSPSRKLAGFDIGYVLLRPPLSPVLVSALNNLPGLSPVSMTPAFDLWQLTFAPARVRVVEPDGTVVAVPSGPISVDGASAPAVGGTLELAEPDDGWQATLNGRPLAQIPSPAGSWAQAFRLPPGGGTLVIRPNALLHDLATAALLLAFCVVAMLALPGLRTAAELQAAAGQAEAAASERDSAPDDQVSRDTPGLKGRARRAVRAARGTAAAPGAVVARASRGLRGSAVPSSSGRDVPRDTRQTPGRGGALSLGGRDMEQGEPSGVGRRTGVGPAMPAGADGSGPHRRPRDAAGSGSYRQQRSGADRLDRDGGRSGPAAGTVGGSTRPGGAVRAGSAGGEPGQARRAERSGTGRRRGWLGRRAPRSVGPADGPAAERESTPPTVRRTAWPADQPASRFMSGPPSSAESYRAGQDGQPRGSGQRGDRRGSPFRSPSGSPDWDDPPSRGQRPAAPQPGRHGQDLPGPARGNVAASWQTADDEAGWPDARYGRGRPPPSAGYPRETRPDADPAVPAQRGWPEESGGLEALPPAELHHDVPERQSRPRRSWMAPDDDTDGDSW